MTSCLLRHVYYIMYYVLSDNYVNICRSVAQKKVGDHWFKPQHGLEEEDEKRGREEVDGALAQSLIAM